MITAIFSVFFFDGILKMSKVTPLICDLGIVS